MALLFWKTLSLVLAAVCGSHPFLVGGHLDNMKDHGFSGEESTPVIISRRVDFDDLDLDLDLTAEESVVEPHADDQPEARYRNPFPFAFNGGKPFSLEKDPITGQIDFEKAPPLKAVNFTDQYDDEFEVEESTNKETDDLAYLKKKNTKEKNDIAVGPNEINPYSPSFHDFLNLPVHYSSEKYVKEKYPLISNSYANTKVQSGSNLYSIYNHRPHHESTTRSSSVNVVTRRAYTTPPIPKTTEPTTTTTTYTTTTTMETPTSSTTREKVFSTSSSAEPSITTNKPSTTTTSRYEEYEDILPIKKLQSQKYDKGRPGPNDLSSHSTKSPSMLDEYMYDYEEDHHENHHSNVSSPPKEKTTATSITPEMMTTSKDYYPTSSTSSSNTQQASMDEKMTTKPPEVISHVTSMPLDNGHTVSSYENVVEGHRPDFFNSVISGPGHVHFPNSVPNRPVGMGSILPESTSNIVIPPDQDTVSFILGNLQNVEGSYYTHDSSIGENTYSGVIGEGSFRPVISSPGQQSLEGSPVGDRVTIALPSVAVVDHGFSNPQQWYKSRPPISDSPISNIPNPQISNFPITNEVDPSGLRPPVLTNENAIRQQESDNKKYDYQNGYVVFPGPIKNQDPQRSVEEHVVVINEANGTIKEFTTSSTTQATVEPAVNNDHGFPQPAENLTPPTERPRPPSPGQRPLYYFHYQYQPTSRPEFSRPSRLPLSPRTKPGSPVEPVILKRRPVSSDTKLPNILPQFRPNAKASHGHRGSETIGTLPSAHAYHSRPRQPPSFLRRPSPPPSYLQRLSPPPLPSASHQVHHLRIIHPKEDVSTNPDVVVKRIRLPPVNPQNPPVRENERIQQNHFPTQKQKLHPEENGVDRFSVDPHQVPPKPVLFPRHRTDDNVPRVATLQMIQQRGGLDETVVRSNLPPPLRGNLKDEKSEDDRENKTDADRRKDDFRDTENTPVEPPVYVVYPVNTAVNIGQDDSREKDESVVVGSHGPHRPLPPDSLLQDEESKEKPEAFPIVALPAKHYTDAASVVVSDFPYPLEIPDPALLSGPVHETPLLVPSDQKQQQNEEGDENLNTDDHEDKDSNLNIIPYLQDFVPFPAKKNNVISTTLHRLPLNSLQSNLQTSTPIAYVFTPTTQPIVHPSDLDSDEISKFDRNEEKPVLLPSQQPSSSSSSAPSPQNFMAPFIASANAETPPKNGWNVVVVETNDRSSATDENGKDALTAEETQTEKSEFDPDNFKPQLFGGFKPIYEFPTEDEEHEAQREKEVKDMPRSLY